MLKHARTFRGYHGSRLRRASPYLGMCLTTEYEAARAHGPHVYQVSLDLQDLKIRDIEFDEDELRARIDKQDWPGDTEAERSALVAEGLDVITYVDVDERGVLHDTLRILSGRASARVHFR